MVELVQICLTGWIRYKPHHDHKNAPSGKPAIRWHTSVCWKSVLSEQHKYKRIFFPFLGLTSFSAALIYTLHNKEILQDSRELTSGHYGYCFILAWVCVPLLLCSGVIYIHLRKKEWPEKGKQCQQIDLRRCIAGENYWVPHSQLPMLWFLLRLLFMIIFLIFRCICGGKNYQTKEWAISIANIVYSIPIQYNAHLLF